MSHALDTILGYRFTRSDLPREALTHRSALQGKRPVGAFAGGSNERLEFIGDRVLGLLIAEWLAERFPGEQEGDLGRRLAALVSQPVLAQVADTIGLGEALSVAPGEARAGVQRRATVLADALEAALGAIFLDGGLEPAREFVRRSGPPHAPVFEVTVIVGEWRGVGTAGSKRAAEQLAAEQLHQSLPA